MSKFNGRPWWYFLDQAGDDSGAAGAKGAEGDAGQGDGKGEGDAEGKEGEGAEGKAGESKKDFEAWLATQPDDVKAMYETHVGGLKSALTDERGKSKDAKKAATRLAELEAAESKRKESAMTDLEKAQTLAATAQAERDEAVEKLTTERVKNAVLAEATKLNFQYPEVAYAMISMAGVTVEDDKITGIGDQLATMIKDMPGLVKPKTDNRLGTPKPGEKRKGEGATTPEVISVHL